MHRELRELLHEAEGQSRHVIVVFLDVRGFSSFARIAESTDTAEFLKSAYIAILDKYFPNAEFFKPTGDGLLLLFGYDRDSLTDAITEAVETSVRLLEDFPTLLDADPMVNFEVPTKLGFGLARGAATSLTAGEKVLDFSGRPLNLASRLMDLARPSGIVFDDSFGYDLLPEQLRERFVQDTAYVKGIAEDQPLTVYYLAGYTKIPESNKTPLDRFIRFAEERESFTFKELEQRLPTYRHKLTHEPSRKDSIEVHMEYPDVLKNGNKNPGLMRQVTLPANYEQVAGESYAAIDYSSKVDELKNFGIKGHWKISAVVEYSIPDATTSADG